MSDATQESSDVLEELMHDSVRRKLTIAAFCFVAVSGTCMLVVGLSSDSMAKRVNELSPLITALYTVFGGVVGAYFGAGVWERTARIKAA